MSDDKTQLGHIESETREGIAIITFYHPSHNSLPGKLLAKLASAIKDAGVDPEAKVVILKSEGDRTFCAGASFDELIAISDETAGKEFFSGFARVINACRTCPKLIIGRVQGKAVGGGVGLASAVDICFATKYSAIKLSELAVGIGPFVVGPAVQRKIGMSAFGQLAIDAFTWQNAYWAKDKGLYAEVYDNIEDMDEAIEILAQRLSHSNPGAMEALKKVLWEGTENWDQLLDKRAAVSGKLVLSEFTRQAIERFKTKN